MPLKITEPKLGRLFVLEGVDGAGKTTLAQALVRNFEKWGERAIYLSFPGREPGSFGAEIYRIHHQELGPRPLGAHPASLQLLHIAAHIDAIENKILPALKQGTHVVLDRFWWSTWVYGVVAGISTSPLKAMIELEHIHWGRIKPAMVFLIIRDRARADDVGADRQARVEEYQKLADNEKGDYPVRQITNNGTRAKALKSITEEINREYLRPVKAMKGGASSPQSRLVLEVSSAVSQIPRVFSRLSPAKTTLVYDSYWRFAHERQQVFFARARGMRWPWTDDSVLRDFKFTNAYRASDRVSQYLIREVIYRGSQSPNEIFFRTLLFKVFNRIDTWELLKRKVGEICYTEYSFKRYNAVLSAAMARGERIYSAAYIMPSGGSKSPSGRKHSMHLKMIEQMVKDDLPSKIACSRSMAHAFELIRAYPTIGDFLAYQYVTDLNYGPLTSFSEMEFVVPGPGAFSGIHKCFSDLGGLTESEIIKVVTDRQEEEFKSLELPFESLWGRPLQLIDCQNLFCEVDKYARVKHPEFSGATGRTRIKQRFKAEEKPIDYWYPPKWGINSLIRKGESNV